ncbi:toll/interleukin-1 receptor domain-containing protein [Alterinioella nitratireducens]|uniref:toll/interleukin-1 receptor domain-containing protein n=1 Tax=Alterinioella nitratireducens TaxID=2735915 RepID=UPI004058F2F2
MAERSRIFISYSHKDRERADFLCDALRERGHPVLIDREGIFEAEHISARIREMIQGSDVVVPVLGPNWIESPACRMEMHLALELNKRILPAAFEDVGPILPDEIREINYVRFYGRGGDRENALNRLDRALDRDIAWVRDHTRYGELASRWASGAGLEPRGRELKDMQRWIERRPRDAPEPTEEQRAYLRAGQRHRKITRWVSSFTIGALSMAAMIIGFFWLSNRQCESMRDWASEAETLEPVAAIRLMLPAAAMSLCRADDAWLQVLGELGRAVQGQRLRAMITLPDTHAQFIDFLPGSGQVITGGLDGHAMLYDPATGAAMADGPAMPDRDVAPRVLLDQGLFLALHDTRATVWNPETRSVLGMPYRGAARVLAATLSPDRDTLVVATAANQLRFHSLISGRALREPLDLGDDITALSFVPDSARVVVAAGPALRVIDLVPALDGRSAGLEHVLPMPGPVTTLSVSADGSTVAAASGNQVGAWDLTTFDELLTPSALYLGGVNILGLGLSPDGLRMVVGADDNRARVHDVPTGKILLNLLGHRDPVRTVRFSPRGDLVLTHDAAGVMRLFDVSTGLLVPTIPNQMVEAVISATEAGANASRAELEGTGIRISVLPNQENVLALRHEGDGAPPFYNNRLLHEGFVTSMALSSDERLLVTGADDGQVRVWDTQTGLQLYQFSHSRDALVPFVGADFTPEGDHIVSWDSNEVRQVWAIEPLQGDLFQTACRLLPFQDGVRSVEAVDAVAAADPPPDPCDNVRLLPQWGAILGLGGG